VTNNRGTNRPRKTCSHIVTSEVHVTRTDADSHSRVGESERVLLAVYPERVVVYGTAGGAVRFDPSTSRLSNMEHLEQDLRDLLPDDLFMAAMDALGMRLTTEPIN
jgi:hypothetical protein